MFGSTTATNLRGPQPSDGGLLTAWSCRSEGRVVTATEALEQVALRPMNGTKQLHRSGTVRVALENNRGSKTVSGARDPGVKRPAWR